jgi:Spy/CpxP family protein refolding chaperone
MYKQAQRNIKRRFEMRKIAALMAAVSLMAFTALAYGAMDGKGKGPGMKCGCDMDGQMMGSEHHMSQIMKGLSLDEQQKAFMGEVKSRMKKETIRRTADMRIVQIELKELLSQDTVDMKAVESKVKQLETMKTEMHLSHIKAMEDCKAKLTPEQRKKMKELMEAGPSMKGKGMKHDHERGMKREKADTKENK